MRKLILSVFILSLIASGLYFTQRSQASVSTTIAPAGTALSTQSGPLWNYPTNSVGCKSSAKEPYVYYTFDITTSGNYTFTMNPSGFPAGTSGGIYVYHSLFNPDNKCNNIVNGQDGDNDYITGNSLTVNLNASQTPARFIVVFTAQNIVNCPNCPNQSINPSNVNGTFSATVSGPAAVSLVQNVSTTIVGAGTPLSPGTNYTWQYPIKSDCSSLSGTVPFAAQKVRISTSGLYTFTMNTSGFPGVIHLYANNFSLDDPCFNLNNDQDSNGYAVTGNSVTIPISVFTPVTIVAVFSPKNPGDTGTFSASVSGPALVTVVSDALNIVSQPSSKSVTKGCQQTLTVYATGPTPQTFQWYDGIAGDLSTSIIILGANSNTYTTPALNSDKSYWVRVTSGSDHVDSDTIAFKVYQTNKTEFNGSLDANQTWNLMNTYCNTSGTFVHYSTTKVRIPVAGSYKVTVHKGGNFSGGYAIHVYSGDFNATTPCLNFDALSINSELTTHLSTGIHTIVVSANTSSEVDGNYIGSISTNDDCSLPETIEQALIISGNPLDKAITPGNTATLTFAYTGGTSMAKVIQWYEGFSGDTSHPIPSATTPIYITPTLNQLSPPYYYYWARVSDSGQSTHADTRTAVVNVLNPPITYSDVLSQCDEVYPQVNGPTTFYKLFPFTVSTDGQYTFNVSANGFTPAVKLYQGFFIPSFPNLGYYGPGTTQTILAGPNTYYLVITSTAANQTGSFTVTINGPALVVPTPRPIITSHPTGKDVFRDQTATFNVTSSTPDVSYQWFKGTCTNKTALSGGNLSSFSTPPLTDYENYWVKVSYGAMYVNSNFAQVRIKPQAITDGYIIDEDNSLNVEKPGVLANDKKADSKIIKAFKVTDPILGIRNLGDDGALIYTPNSNANGPDVFKYMVSDGTLDSDSENIAVLVRAINDAPVMTGGTFNNHTFNEDSAIGTLHLGGVTFSVGGGPDESSQQLTYKVTAVPPASAGNVMLADNTTVVAANSTYTISQIQGMQFKPASNGYGGPYPFTLTVTDNGSSYSGPDPKSITQSLNITVNAVADTPSATSATTDEDMKTLSGLVLSRHANDGAEVGYFKIRQIKNGTLNKNDGVTQISNDQFITYAEGHAGLKFSPNANLFSPNTIFSFEVQASLTAGNTGLGGDTLTVAVTVNPVAELPSVTSAATFVNLQTSSGLVITRNPTDGSEIGYFKISSITNGKLYKSDGTTQISEGQYITVAEGSAGLKFTPALDSIAQGSFIVRGAATTAGSGLGSAVGVNITVSKYNTSTTITSDNPAPSYPDQPVAVHYEVLNTSGQLPPLGDVVVTVSGGSETCTGTVAAGSCTLTLTTAGNPRTITATYVGNSQFQSSAATKDHVVNACIPNPVVTSTADDGTPGTLRYSVTNACAGSTITFDPTVFNPANGPYVISVGTFGNLATNLLIDRNLIIKGPGANILNVRRSTLSRTLHFRIFNIASGATATISGLTISNGFANDGVGINDANGGGILNSGTLTLDACVVSGNQAGREGLSSGSGGGIYNTGALTVINSTISGNNAFIGNGGGVFIQNGSTASIINSTISGNTAAVSGGGIAVSGAANIFNSTITTNTGTVSAGGMYCELGMTTIGNSIVAGNSAAANSDVLQLSGLIKTKTHNLIGQNDGAESTFVSGVPNGFGDFVGTSGSPVFALLGTLTDNGGPTQTHVPLPGSPALDSGSNANLPQDTLDLDGDSNTAEALPEDQRGQSRITNSSVDIGAIEVSYSISAKSGGDQSAVINSLFTSPLQATVSESGKVKSGASVTFTAPANGTGGKFNGNLATTVVTDNDGVATAPAFTANGTVGNYNVVASLGAGLPWVAFNMTNTQASAQVVLSNLTQVFDGGPKTVSATTSPSGLPVAFTYDGAVTPPSNAGTYDVSATVTDPNYAGQTTGTLSIGKANQTINFSALLNKTYGDADFTITATSGSGLAVTFAATGNCTATTASPGTVHITGVGGCSITASQSGNANFNAANPVSQTFNIAKAHQAITFAALGGKTFGDTDFNVIATSDSGLPVGLAATGNCTVTSPAPGTVHLTGGGSCTITASQAGNSNYNAASNVPQSFTIAKANQAITFGALVSKTFGDPDFTVSATSNSGLPVSFAATGNCIVTATSPGTVHLNGAGSCTITASQGGNSSYNGATNVPQSFTISKANQAITFAGLSDKTFGDPDFAINATSNSGLSVSLAATGNCTVTALSPGTVHLNGAGSCTITASQAGNSNHNGATNVPQSFTIAKANQAITFGGLSGKTFGDPDFTVNATSNSGLPVSLAGTGNCTVTALSPGTVHINGAGSCTINTSQAGNSNYNAATNITQSFNIAKANQVITFGALAGKTFGDPDFPVSVTSNSGTPVSLAASGNCTVTSPAPGTVHLTGGGSCTITASQAGSSNYNAAINVTQSFSIARANQTITFGALSGKTFRTPDFSVSAISSSGLPVSLAATGSCTVTALSPGTVHLTGAGSCTITASQAGNSDYNAATNVLQSFGVAKAVQTITFNGLSDKTFGDSDFTVNATSSAGFPVSLVATGNCTVTSPAPGTVHLNGAGSCTITASQVGNSNYTAATNVTQSFSIAKANQTITFGGLTDKTFGDPDFTVNATSNSGLTVSLNATGNCTVTSPAPGTVHLNGSGSCLITASQAGNSNYNAASNVPQSFTIGRANQTITFFALANKTFGDPDFAVSATATSGLPVSFTATENCSVTGGTVHITGQGSCTITASQAGNTNYKPAADVPRTFNITLVNTAPTANNDTLTDVAEDSGQRAIPFADLTGNDVKGPSHESGQTLSVIAASNAVGGTVSILGTNVMFTPAPDFNGLASFSYTITDNGTTNGAPDPQTSATGTASFNITAVADTPSVTSATSNANTQTTAGLVISRNSVDGAEVTHFRVAAITGGTLFRNNGVTPINNGDFITFAEGNAGLKFTPGTSNGSFTVQASVGAADAGLGGGIAMATITVNELGGVIRFKAANYSVAEAAGSKTITVERTGDTSQAVTVDYATSDHSNPADFVPCTSPGAGFASSRCDFTTAVGTLRFAAGETSKTFNVLISQDNYVEDTESLELTLSNPNGGAVFGVPSTATLSITDDAVEPAPNSIDTSSEFVRSQYHDVLNREPDAPGLAFWTDNIEKCNDPSRKPADQTVAECIDKQRESTAIAFFMSPEFQMTGGFVYHLYKGSLPGTPNYDGGSPGRFPTSLEFMRDVRQVSEGIVVNNQISGAVVEANRNRLAAEFVLRPEFVAKYGGLNHELYVQELFNTTGITEEQFSSGGSNSMADQKQALVDALMKGTETRASVLRKIVDGTVVINEGNVQFTTSYGQAFSEQEYRRMFVFMEYVGYLRRNPDPAGFVFWLGKLNQYNGDPFQAEMVRSFILSPEYRSRFGQN